MFAFEVKKVLDLRDSSVASRGMIVLLVKQVHLQKDVGARSNVSWTVSSTGHCGGLTGREGEGQEGEEKQDVAELEILLRHFVLSHCLTLRSTT